MPPPSPPPFPPPCPFPATVPWCCFVGVGLSRLVVVGSRLLVVVVRCRGSFVGVGLLVIVVVVVVAEVVLVVLVVDYVVAVVVLPVDEEEW